MQPISRNPALRTTSVVAALVASIALAGASPADGQSARGESASASVVAAASTQAVPRGLERFYDQTLKFGDCAPYATNALDEELFAGRRLECARLTVPLNYDRPKGRKAQIAVLRSPARGNKIGSLVVNPGGPGPSGAEYAVLAANALTKNPITKRFDIVGFDPRGTAASTPTLDCFTHAERDDDAMVVPWIAGGGDFTKAHNRRLAKQCARRSGGRAVLAHSGTRDVARDMDVLREVLGDEQLTYAGASWGTRLGAVYAEMFPQNVRAMVLDGAIDPSQRAMERVPQQFKSFQRAFGRFAEFCAQQGECPLGTDPAQATDRFKAIMRPIVDNPAATKSGRSLSYRSALDAVLASMYDRDSYWEALVVGLTELEAGRGDVLMAIRDSYSRREQDGTYTDFLESTTAVYCADEQRLTPDEATRLRRKVLKAAPMVDYGEPVRTRDQCEFWPSQPTLFPYAQDIEDLAPPLVVSITGDPATPFQDGFSLAESLGGAVLTVEGDKHGAILIAGSKCVDKATAKYLINRELPGDDAGCKL